VRPGSCLLAAETALTMIILGAALWAGSHSVRSAHASLAIVLGLVSGQIFLHLVGIDRAIVDPNPASFLRRIAGSLVAGVFLAGVLLTILPDFHDGYLRGLAAWILSLVFVIAIRPILRSLIRGHRLIRTMMILGSGELGDRLSRELATGDDVVCSVTSMPDSDRIRLQHEDVSGIVVADLHMATEGAMAASLIDSKLRGLRIEPGVESCERICKKIWIPGLHPEWWIYSDGFVPTRPLRALKRSIDVAGSLIMSLFAAPVMIATALLIRLTSAGPVFYRQERLGQYGRPFMVLKFRSMYANAEAGSGPVWASKNDTRITPLGRLLRKFRIDELPAVQCAEGRNVLRRPSARTSLLHGLTPARNSLLRPSSLCAPGNHGVGAGYVSLWRVHRRRLRETSVRPLLRQAHVALPRFDDPGEDDQGRVAGKRQVTQCAELSDISDTGRFHIS